MTVSSGFFNSVNHDRLYNAEQLSSIFDGIIIDGVYENYGDAFMVTANPEANSSVLIGTGRAWFDHTWTVNDSTYAMQLDPPNEMLGRIDAIVLDIDRRNDVRKNGIVYLKGSESTPDQPPTLIDEDRHNQYPLAYITRTAGPDAPIQQKDIDYQVGTAGDTPIVTGILEAQNLENLWAQLNDEFDEWWDGIKATLDENTVTNLQNQINELKEKIEGDDALVGLLTKPVYEAFKSGDYGLSVNAYSATPDDGTGYQWSTIEDAQCGAFFLPNGHVAHVWINKNSGGAGASGTFAVSIDLINRNGVVTTVSSERYPTNSTNSGSVGLNVFPISIDSFPVKFGVAVLATAHTGNIDFNFAAHFITVTISSSMTASFSKVDAQELVGHVPKGTGSATLYHYMCGHGCLLPSGQFIAASGFNKNYVNVFSMSPEGVVSSKQTNTSSMTTNQGLFGYPGSGSYFPTYMLLTKESKVLVVGFRNGGTPSFVRAYGYIDPYSLSVTDITEVTNNGGMGDPDPDWLPPDYYNLYREYNTYTVNEKNGVLNQNITTFSDNVESIKETDYFMGASNAGIPLPNGTFVASHDSTGYVGIASTGNHMYVGTNGGAAILSSKSSISLLDSSLKTAWCKGYIDNENVLGYLYAQDEDKAEDEIYGPTKSWLFSGDSAIKLSVVLLNKG